VSRFRWRTIMRAQGVPPGAIRAQARLLPCWGPALPGDCCEGDHWVPAYRVDRRKNGTRRFVRLEWVLMGRRSGTGDAAGVPPSTWAGYAPEVEP